MTLNELFQHGQEAAEYLFGQQGYVVPMMIGEDTEGNTVPMAFNIGENKDMAAEGLKKFLVEHQIERYVSLVEAWVYEAKPDDPDAQAMLSGEARVSDHPQRKEVIQITAEDKNGECKSGFFRIVREKGKKATLSEFKELPEAALATGRFMGLLGEKTRH